jgi:outer membrane protease
MVTAQRDCSRVTGHDLLAYGERLRGRLLAKAEQVDRLARAGWKTLADGRGVMVWRDDMSAQQAQEQLREMGLDPTALEEDDWHPTAQR